MRLGSIIKIVRSKKSGEIDEVFDWASDLAIELGADHFVWDGDGMGAVLKRQVQLAFDGTKCEYHMFKGSLSGSGQDHAEEIYLEADGDDKAPKKYKEVFKNNRAQYYISLADRFYNTFKCVERGEYIDPDLMISLDSDGIEDMIGLRVQVCTVPRKNNPNGLQQIMSKQEMLSKHKIKSPNEADSLMMSLFNPPSVKVHEKIDFTGWR